MQNAQSGLRKTSLGGITLIAKDYVEPFDGTSTDPPIARFLSHFMGSKRKPPREAVKASDPIQESVEQLEKDGSEEEMQKPIAVPAPSSPPAMTPLTLQPTNRTNRSSSISFAIQEAGHAGAAPFSLLARTGTIAETQEEPTRPNTRPGSLYHFVQDIPTNLHIPKFRFRPNRIWKKVAAILAESGRQLVTPPTIALAASLIIALVRPLKAMFVHVPGYSFHQAPDGRKTL